MANNAVLSTKEAAEESGFSARHIQKMIKTGKLSASRAYGGSYLIDKSEFYRVFPGSHAANTARTDAKNDDISSRTVFELQIKHLQAINNLLTDQIEAAATREAVLMETLSNTQRLIGRDSNRRKNKRLLGIFGF